MAAPCMCGHAIHWRSTCAECECECSCPDYVAAAERAGREPSWADRESTASLVLHFRWRAPGGETVTERSCVYCEGVFGALRHKATCSAACKMSMSRALAYGDDSDLPHPLVRRDCFSRERQLSTGWGLMTRRETYNADLRVRKRAREKVNTTEALCAPGDPVAVAG